MQNRDKVFTFAPLYYGKVGGLLAQLVEQWIENPCVPSSILGGTTEASPRPWSGVFAFRSGPSGSGHVRDCRPTTGALLRGGASWRARGAFWSTWCDNGVCPRIVPGSYSTPARS